MLVLAVVARAILENFDASSVSVAERIVTRVRPARGSYPLAGSVPGIVLELTLVDIAVRLGMPTFAVLAAALVVVPLIVRAIGEVRYHGSKDISLLVEHARDGGAPILGRAAARRVVDEFALEGHLTEEQFSS